jgi:hypothetical protein
MSTTVKRSVSLDEDLDLELSERYGRGGKSRFLNDAARDALTRVKIAELLERYDAAEGPVPDDVRDDVSSLTRPV